MHGQVLQHQVERRGRILQIVDEERRHGLEGLEFPGLEQPLGELRVEQPGGGMLAHAFEHVEILQREDVESPLFDGFDRLDDRARRGH